MSEPAGDDRYRADFLDILADEHEYIGRRRERYGIRTVPPDDLWGLCISGGGVRSATFALGVLQSLMKRELFRRFDYLSTVSGGGYIGACLTSLLTRAERPPAEGVDPMEGVGVDADDSPFVGLRQDDDYRPADETRIGVRHQIHHLRTHGEYLTPHKGVMNRDVQRAIGSVVSGVLHHFLLFFLGLVVLCAAAHLVLSTFDPDLSLIRNVEASVPPPVGANADPPAAAHGVTPDAEPPTRDPALLPVEVHEPKRSARSEGLDYIRWIVNDQWWDERVKENVGILLYSEAGLLAKRWELLPAVAAGAFYSLMALFTLWILPKGTRPGPNTPAGFTPRDHWERTAISTLNAGAIGSAFALLLYYGQFHGTGERPYVLFVPAAMGLGGMLVIAVVHYLLGRHAQHDSLRLTLERRSGMRAVQGGALYAAAGGVLLPFLVVIVFSLTELAWLKLLGALFGLGGGFALIRSTIGERTADEGPSRLARFAAPLASLLVVLGVALSLASVSDLLSEFVYPEDRLRGAELGPRLAARLAGLGWNPVSGLEPLQWSALGTLVLGCLLLYVAGTRVSANRLSPHYFYRDRLSEAFLKTYARTQREPRLRQGRPLTVLRDDASLKLRDLGKVVGRDGREEPPRAPYHLIVTSINLVGSSELNRKTHLSDHFVFSPKWVGSSVTGYMRTEAYEGGETEVGRAMTISGAAVSSGAGQFTSGWWSFVMTLFNFRLGYWMANPWKFGAGLRKKPLRRGLRPRHRRNHFWLRYLFYELWGLLDARGELVHLSDGGHTGDNLGLYPLLQRRCRTIVVCDGERDPGYAFGSFNAALRLAYTELNVDVRIDLSSVRPAEADGRPTRPRSPRAVVLGTIVYPRVVRGGAVVAEAFEGTLLYVKAAIPATPPPAPAHGDVLKVLPAHVLNYAEAKREFPHQSTADQFFDDAQFESYRSLGEFLGTVASHEIEALDAARAAPPPPGSEPA